ncbi:MAG: hypothetical protein ACLRKZ_02885 [Acutalibacteraceae bacterium]
MNLNYRVEEAFDKLENAIACAELHDSTSAADAERYAQLLDDIVGLRDGAKKETAPAVGATEAAKENRSTFSVAENGGDVKRPFAKVTRIREGCFEFELEAKGKASVIELYCAAYDGFVDTAVKNGIPIGLLELTAKDSKRRTM